MLLAEDVNLKHITISDDGTSVRLGFCDMYAGRDVISIQCSQVFVFKYQNTFEATDGLPIYVGEIVCGELNGTDVQQTLSRLGYGFRGADGVMYRPGSGSLFQVHLEGGEIEIDIVCGKLDYAVTTEEETGSPISPRRAG